MDDDRETVECDFGALVYQQRAKLYGETAKHLRLLLGPQWHVHVTKLGISGKLAIHSPLFYAIKAGEFEIPLTINTRGNRLKIMSETEETYTDLQELSAALERIVRSGRVKTHEERIDADMKRISEINRKRGRRKNKKTKINTGNKIKKNEPQNKIKNLSSSDARTIKPEPKPKPEVTTYLQRNFDEDITVFNDSGAKGKPLSNDKHVRLRRTSLLCRVQGVFRRVRDHLEKTSGSHTNIDKFNKLVHQKISGGEIPSLEQYKAMCRMIVMLQPEVMNTQPPHPLQTDFNRLVKEIKVF